MYGVIIDRSPDPDDLTIIAGFASSEEAQGYIEAAHDPDDDCEPSTCDHMNLDDVGYARVAYINVRK